MKRETTCTFTGHRENKLPWHGDESDPRCVRLKERIYDAAEAAWRGGVRHYICGMATGCDLYFCEAVIALREEHPEITLEAAVPYEAQAAGWSADLRSRYDRLLAECDYRTVLQKYYTQDCMLRRNRYMVDASAVLISAYNGAPGGTQSTLLYALRQGLEIIELPMEE